MKDLYKIVKTEVLDTNVTITLENGVTVSISSNPKYFHVHFSGTKDHVVASLFANDPNLPKMKLSNYVDLAYEARKED